MTSNQLLIVQPWFTAKGHPAQSLLNTARVLGRGQPVSYVLSWDTQRSELLPVLEQLRMYGVVHQFPVRHSSLASGTAVALWRALSIARRLQANVSIFFLDGHVPVISALWPIASSFAHNVRSISVLGLSGPEIYTRRLPLRWLIARFLRTRNSKLFLRTEELASAWRDAFHVDRHHIDTLPSLEIPEMATQSSPAEPNGPTRFGVIGQVRPGKGLEWLVPMFEMHEGIGELYVAGAFFNEAQRQRLSFLQSYGRFREEFIPDDQLVFRSSAFDYLLVMYDDWDPRFEAATLYLAARAGRPVICYDQGWCGRMIRQYQCGVAVPPGLKPGPEYFRALPGRETDAYAHMVAGMRRFHASHSGETRRAEFVRKLLKPDP